MGDLVMKEDGPTAVGGLSSRKNDWYKRQQSHCLEYGVGRKNDLAILSKVKDHSQGPCHSHCVQSGRLWSISNHVRLVYHSRRYFVSYSASLPSNNKLGLHLHSTNGVQIVPFHILSA